MALFVQVNKNEWLNFDRVLKIEQIHNSVVILLDVPSPDGTPLFEQKLYTNDSIAAKAAGRLIKLANFVPVPRAHGGMKGVRKSGDKASLTTQVRNTLEKERMEALMAEERKNRCLNTSTSS